MNRDYGKVYWQFWLATLVLTGCTSNHYEIELKPTGDTIQRELTCWQQQSSNEQTQTAALPEGDLKRIAAAYGVDTSDTKAKEQRFAREFAGKMPDDVGGDGSYTHWNTPLGSVSAYVERFRGSDDLLTMIQQRQEASDRTADLLIDWLAIELKDETGLAQLRGYLDHQFRQDLRNLSLYSWASDLVMDREGAQEEYLVRVAQYLVERSYFTPDQIPIMARSFQGSESASSNHLLAIIQRFLASKMGVAEDQPIPSSLDFLNNETVLHESLDSHIRQTDDYRQLLDNWKREKAQNPDANEPEPSEVLTEHLMQAFLPSLFFGRPDKVSVKLALASEPFLTNGQWDAEAKRVQWSKDMLPNGSHMSEFPAFMFAFWSEPDEQAQMKHFGRIVLEDSELGSYCLWYRGLSSQEAATWNEFVSGLRRGATWPSDSNRFSSGKTVNLQPSHAI